MTPLRDTIVKADLAKLADMRDLLANREPLTPHERAWLCKMAERGVRAEPPPCRCCGTAGADWDRLEMCDECYADYEDDMREEMRKADLYDSEYDRQVDQMLAEMERDHGDTPKGA